MVDLDVLEENDSGFELYCRIGILLITGRINYLDWRSTVRALGIDRYVIPAERALVEPLLDEIYNRHKKSSTMLLWHSLLMGHIESHYTEAHQVRMLSIIMSSEKIRWKPRA